MIRDPQTQIPILVPPGASLNDNVDFGLQIANMPSIIANGAMIAAFMRGGTVDYQRLFSDQSDSNGNPLINRSYIDFGNYNYGVVTAAAGYTYDQALDAAIIINDKNIIQHPFSNAYGTFFGGNPRNNAFIKQGFEDYRAGKIKGSVT